MQTLDLYGVRGLGWSFSGLGSLLPETLECLRLPQVWKVHDEVCVCAHKWARFIVLLLHETAEQKLSPYSALRGGFDPKFVHDIVVACPKLRVSVGKGWLLAVCNPRIKEFRCKCLSCDGGDLVLSEIGRHCPGIELVR